MNIHDIHAKLDAQNFADALDDLDYLLHDSANTPTGDEIRLAKNLCETYQASVCSQLNKWADGVVAWSKNNILLTPSMFDGDFSDSLNAVEEKLGIEANHASSLPQLHIAQEIIKAEKAVRPGKLTAEMTKMLEKFAFEGFSEVFQKRPLVFWESLSGHPAFDSIPEVFKFNKSSD